MAIIDNGNACENDLFKDGLHLQNSGKKILSQNFIVNLQTYGTFLEKRTWSPNIGRWETCVASATAKPDLQMLHDLKFDYPKNLLCGI